MHHHSQIQFVATFPSQNNNDNNSIIYPIISKCMKQKSATCNNSNLNYLLPNTAVLNGIFCVPEPSTSEVHEVESSLLMIE